jgi:nitrogen regulatory protein PII
MSLLGHIGYGVEKNMITAIAMNGRGLDLMKLVEEQEGVLSVTYHHARGTDRRGKRPGNLVWIERDVLMVLVEAQYADEVFDQLFHAGEFGVPHQGVIFMEEVSRGHPMMPFPVGIHADETKI